MLPLFLVTIPKSLLVLGTLMCFINVKDWYSNNVMIIGALIAHNNPAGYLIMIYGLICFITNKIIVKKIDLINL